MEENHVIQILKLSFYKNCLAESILFYPITLEGHWGTTDEFATIPLVELAKSIPVRSLILSSHLFFCHFFFFLSLCPVGLSLLNQKTNLLTILAESVICKYYIQAGLETFLIRYCIMTASSVTLKCYGLKILHLFDDESWSQIKIV